MDGFEFLQMNDKKLLEATIWHYVKRSVNMVFSLIQLYVLFNKIYDAFTGENHVVEIGSFVYVVQKNVAVRVF